MCSSDLVKVMKAAAAKTGLQIQWSDHAIGKRGHELHGHTFPQQTQLELEKLDGWLCGPIGHNAYPRGDPTWIMPPVRKRFELYANIKPVKSYPNIESVHKDVDIVFLREVTEGMQSQVQGAEQIRQAMDALTQNAARAREATSEFAQAAATLKESLVSLRSIVGG